MRAKVSPNAPQDSDGNDRGHHEKKVTLATHSADFLAIKDITLSCKDSAKTRAAERQRPIAHDTTGAGRGSRDYFSSLDNAVFAKRLSESIARTSL